MDWQGKTAAELGRGIAAGDINPVELTTACLDATETHPSGPMIYARLTRDRALAEARAARSRAHSGHRLSPLDGVPLSWKDLFDTAGTETEAGTALLKGRIPDRDAEVLANATAAGTICLGKTHMSEIAFSGLGYNPITATPPNLHDPDAVPGGSSSGAAASVAFGLAPAAIGSDTGGSVRIPSAWNDLVGFKPTHGRLSLKGVVPLCKSFDTVGPLCRSVEDANLLTAILGGTKPADLEGSGLSGTRLLIPETVVMDDLDAAPARGFEDAVSRLAAAGATIHHAPLPMLPRAYELAAILYTAESWAYWRPLIEADPGKMYAQIYERITQGGKVSAADFIAGWDELRALRAAYAEVAAGYDAVICPTGASLPPKVADLLADDAYYKAVNLKALRNTRLANLMGLCALTLPTGTPCTGLMLNAAAGADGKLLRLAAAAERALA
jgi:aspartyl-tRNA(Asn)/glutamyl-tRNA(Gln) amidotransferase subunit A